jgi:hypothetical protein
VSGETANNNGDDTMQTFMRHSLGWSTLVLFAAVTGCELPPEEDTVTSESQALKISPVGPKLGGGGLVIADPLPPPPGPTYAPPVSAPGSFSAGGRSSSSATVGWYETGNPINPQTMLYRQQYDLDDHPVGTPKLVKTFTALPAGPVSFVDSAETSDDHTAPDPDRKVCYQLQEKNGECGPGLGGYTCLWTGWECVYTRAVTPHPVGRVQLRIKMSSAATAAAPGDRVEVRLQSPFYPYASLPRPRGNSTWIDSTRTDFTAGFQHTYDLNLKEISDLSDITQITIATPDEDWLCINELELIADNTTAFRKSFGADGVNCIGAWNSDALDGYVASISFGELRRSPEWQGFNPPNLTPFIPGTPHTFVGYRASELIAMLDAKWGHELRNPANDHGPGAGLRNAPTATQRINVRRLRVWTHVIAEDWENNGGVAADPEYDLVIHNDASCAPKEWCVAIEAIEGHSSSSGWWAIFPILGSLIQAGINSSANGEIAAALRAMGGNAVDAPPSGTEYCFPGDNTERSFFLSDGFGAGSFTLCPAGTGTRTTTTGGVDGSGGVLASGVAVKAQLAAKLQ